MAQPPPGPHPAHPPAPAHGPGPHPPAPGPGAVPAPTPDPNRIRPGDVLRNGYFWAFVGGAALVAGLTTCGRGCGSDRNPYQRSIYGYDGHGTQVEPYHNQSAVTPDPILVDGQCLTGYLDTGFPGGPAYTLIVDAPEQSKTFKATPDLSTLLELRVVNRRTRIVSNYVQGTDLGDEELSDERGLFDDLVEKIRDHNRAQRLGN